MNQLNVNLPELPYAVSEAMNRLRINIKFCGKNTRKILLTSCQPNEGKSTISSVPGRPQTGPFPKQPLS